MDSNSDSSMLSDELKPRRTPVPSLFGDLMPRPSVPDLSIIETPQTTLAVQPQVPSYQPQTALDHLSYNDWRLRTGVSSDGNSGNHSPRSTDSWRTSHMPPVRNQVNFSFNGPPQERNNFQKARVDERVHPVTHQSAGKVSYKEFQKRPMSAPAVRPQQVESDKAREHPLSKSAPPVKSPSQNDYNRYPLAANLGSTTDPSTRGQHPLSNMALISQSSANYQNLNHQRVSASMTSHSQNFEQRRRNNGFSQASLTSNVVTELPVLYNEPGRNTIQHAGGDVPYNPAYSFPARDAVHGAYPSECYHPVRKNAGPWTYESQTCCPSAMAPCHPANHMHPVHGPPYPQVSYDDLYKIVLAQNDQLKSLQAQVERLLITQDHRPESSVKKNEEKLPALAEKTGSKLVTEEGTQTSDCEALDDDCQKMSIGVMTSFIHAVTYRGRVSRLDAAHNVSENEGNQLKNSSSKSHSSEDSSNSLSPPSKSSSQTSCTNCCKDCSSKAKHSERTRNQTNKTGKLRHTSTERLDHLKSPPKSNGACPDGCNCNNPGVSAAITAVRGCQAVLASKAGGTTHDYSTFNGADLPTVTEQPVSPMSSIHVDLHDYRSSSSDESTSSHSDDEASSDEGGNSTDRDCDTGTKPIGWTFYNNMLGQVNKILEERETPSSSPKQTDVSVSKRVAFEAPNTKTEQRDLKEMAIRYLKENHPEELSLKKNSKRSKKASGEKAQEMAVYNMPAANMSFATFRYLERYNLLPDNFNPQQYLEAAANMQGFHGRSQEPHHSPSLNRASRKQSRMSAGKCKTRSNVPVMESPGDLNYQLQPISNGPPKRRSHPPPVHHASPSKHPQLHSATSKILDITTLRQQPKLL